MTTPQRGLPSDEALKGWQQTLQQEPARMRFLNEERGLDDETIRGARLGWTANRYTIPVFDADKRLVNVRHYGPRAKNKMLSETGHGTPRLYLPYLSPSDTSTVLVVEGELDCLKAGQELEDVWCVSGTGGAGAPPSVTELEPLRGRDVVIAYDCDKAGKAGARKLAGWLETVAASVAILDLGLGEGEDVTDWFVKHERSSDDLRNLMLSAPRLEAASPSTRRDVEELLTLAVGRKVDGLGSRNAAGFWLACQLRDEKYTRPETEPILLRYADSVRYLKPDPYTDREALASLESAYAGVPRDAVGTVGAAYGYDDIGNAERLIDRHGADMRYVAAYGGWHAWDGRRWAADDSGGVERWAKQTARAMRQEAIQMMKSSNKETVERGKHLLGWATTSASAAKLTSMLRLARVEHDRTTQQNITLPASAFDADPHVFVAPNGTLELGDRVALREHRRSDLARRVAGAAYGVDAVAPEWTRFLESALPDEEVRSYLQRLTAYAAFTVGNPLRLLVFLIGVTSSGKTTFGQIMLSILGDYADTFELSMLRAKQSEGPRPDLVSAFSRRLLFTTEASQEWELHADHIKRITGNDSIKVRNLHSGEFVTGIPAFTPFIATNKPPRITGADRALWRRLVVVPFDVSFLGREDEHIKDRILATEREGVLRWLAEGWDAFRRDGLDSQPVAAMNATLKLRQSLSPVDEWIAECADQETTAEELFGALWDSFRTWQIEGGTAQRRQLTKQEFKAVLDDRQFVAFRRRLSGDTGDLKHAFRRGLRLTGEQHRVRRGDGSWPL